MRTGTGHASDSRRRLRGAALGVLGLLAVGPGCGDALGPGASPEADVPGSRSAAEVSRARQEHAAVHFGLPVEIRDVRGELFRLVPPGTFRMGTDGQESGRGADEDQHSVTLLVPYYLQAAEVSWREVRAFDAGLCPPVLQEADDLPAHGLTYEQVTGFIAWLNTHDGLWYHRLPSEAEWELACRAGSPAAWSSGDAPPQDAWVGVSGGAPRAVGRGHPNALGLHDMHGNVAEWCRPWYAPYPTHSVDLPVGPLHGEERVVRGGSWSDGPSVSRSAARAHLPPTAADRRVGFRLLVEAGYGLPELGAHRVHVQTYTGAIGTHGRAARPGYRVRLVSVPERLTARQEDRVIRWRELDTVTPFDLSILPGRYYLQAWRMQGDAVVRGPERKFMIPEDLPEIDLEVPPD